MSRAELVVSKEWLEENISKGLIRQQSAQFTGPVQVEKKPDAGLRFCIDYGDINSKTNNNWYPLSINK